MAQTIRLTITPDLEKALQILRQSTFGTLNTTELIKMALGEIAKQKEAHLSQTKRKERDISPDELDKMSALQFYKWAKEDGTLQIDNIAHPEKLKPFIPKPYVRTR